MGAIGIPVKLQKFARSWSDLGAEEVRVTLEPLPHRLLEGQGPRLKGVDPAHAFCGLEGRPQQVGLLLRNLGTK